MSDRVKAFIVTLERDNRDDDCESLRDAIRCFQGVLSVEPVKADVQGHVAEQRAVAYWRDRLADVLWPKESAGD